MVRYGIRNAARRKPFGDSNSSSAAKRYFMGDLNLKAKELCDRGCCVSMGEARRIVYSGLFEKVRHKMEVYKKDFMTIDWNKIEVLDWVQGVGEILSVYERDVVRKIGVAFKDGFLN